MLGGRVGFISVLESHLGSFVAWRWIDEVWLLLEEDVISSVDTVTLKVPRKMKDVWAGKYSYFLNNVSNFIPKK